MRQEVISAYGAFIDTAWPYVHITNEEDYQESLELLESLLESSQDSKDDPMNPLIDLISKAIERYESADETLKTFVEEADDIPKDIALLRTLMSQHRLTGSDFPEIGSKSMVSKVLNGSRTLSREAIERLCARFQLHPSMFF